MLTAMGSKRNEWKVFHNPTLEIPPTYPKISTQWIGVLTMRSALRQHEPAFVFTKRPCFQTFSSYLEMQ
jgi:hypothetical protein